jgi:menaquinone-dependent protoporphyrinogen IX oxidase
MSAAPVLVAYASKHSSTAEIAERIAAAMREAGCAAEARPASEVDDLSGYAAVVLGSAVYAKRWQRDARAFARRHAAELKDMPVWLFSSGPFGAPEDHPTAPTPPVADKLVKQLGAREQRHVRRSRSVGPGQLRRARHAEEHSARAARRARLARHRGVGARGGRAGRGRRCCRLILSLSDTACSRADSAPDCRIRRAARGPLDAPPSGRNDGTLRRSGDPRVDDRGDRSGAAA